eukprot:423894_1
MPMGYLFTFILLSSTCSLDIDVHSWKQKEISPSYLFQGQGQIGQYRTFIAKQNDSIFIVGGKPTGTLLIEYDTESHSFTAHPNKYDFNDQYAQSSIQIENDLFMLPYNNINIYKLNLNTLNAEIITIFPGEAARDRCMIYFNSYLIVIGGYNNGDHYYDNMSIYSISEDQWFNGPSLASARAMHSCNVMDQTIYVFAGYDGTNYVNDIWMLQIDDINNCCSNQWIQSTATLSTAKVGHRSISVGSNIYIIGGSGNGGHLKEVDVLDTESNEIWSYSDMIYGQSLHSAIEVNSIIYVFAGYPTTNYQFYQKTNLLPTLSPTISPSSAPSNSPSLSPTQNPSNPTINPTFSPSSSPTSPPSNNPSFSPTRFPTSRTEYQWKFRVNYQIKYLSQFNIDNLNENNIKNNLISLIETEYVNTYEMSSILQCFETGRRIYPLTVKRVVSTNTTPNH